MPTRRGQWTCKWKSGTRNGGNGNRKSHLTSMYNNQQRLIKQQQLIKSIHDTRFRCRIDNSVHLQSLSVQVQKSSCILYVELYVVSKVHFRLAVHFSMISQSPVKLQRKFPSHFSQSHVTNAISQSNFPAGAEPQLGNLTGKSCTHM